MSDITSQLRIMRKLDVLGLSEEAIEHFTQFEDGPALVDTERARDYVWTDEIVANTLEFVITDPDGEILADGFQNISDAERARAGAKLRFTLSLDEDEEE